MKVEASSLNWLSDLSMEATYYVKSYAINSIGIIYGNEINFTTLNVPTLSTNVVSSITKYSATSGGNIINNGGTDIISCGICWSTDSSPIIKLSTKTDEEIQTRSFASITWALTTSTTYYIRVYAINQVGVSYGKELTFTTNAYDGGLAIGQDYAGWIIFYIDETEEHGLVCTPEDQDLVVWECTGQFILGIKTELGTGFNNTIAIVNNCSNSNDIAAGLCYNLVFNQYDDWYLPSRDELNLIYTNVYKNGLGNFQYNSYRSSSDYDGNSTWTQQFPNGTQYNLWKTSKVGRAIRKF